MVLGHHGIRSRRTSTASNSNRSSIDETNMAGGDDETIVDPDQGNVLSHLISQLRPGADLSRVTLPTFILEPRSMLERITNFMAHPETLLPLSTIDDPTERFIGVVKWYLSGWHIKPAGVKKPLNPILGETYTCYWEYPDSTKGYYIAEQTSHHPPKSSYFFMAPEHHIRIDGTLKPRSKFLGNSAASLMEGIAVLRILNRGKGPRGEKYILTQPNMYARGILFGKMKYELGDHLVIQCAELGLTADVEFKTKGYFSGTYNAIGGTIKRGEEVLFEFSGMWNGEMYIRNVLTGKKDLLFDARAQKPTPPSVRPIEEQSERESQRLWHTTVQAVIARDHDKATEEKSKIEDTQREEAAKRVADGVDFQPRYFRAVRSAPGQPEEGEDKLDWILKKEIDGRTPEEQVKQILSIAPIIRGQNFHERMPIPPSRHSRQSLDSLRSGKSHPSQHENEAPSVVSSQQQMPNVPQGRHNEEPVGYGVVSQNERPVSRDNSTPVPPQAQMQRPTQPPVRAPVHAPAPVSIQAQAYIPEQPIVEALSPAAVVTSNPVQSSGLAGRPDYVEAGNPAKRNIVTEPPLDTLSWTSASGNVRGDLISGDATPTQGHVMQQHYPADLVDAQTENGGAAQRELESQLAQTGSTPRASALQDFHNEMRENLPGVDAKPPLSREESEDSSDFVDAKSTL